MVNYYVIYVYMMRYAGEKCIESGFFYASKVNTILD